MQQIFFSKEWLEAFLTSFRNFLTLIFRNLPLPKLLAFQLTRLEEPSLKMRLKVSQSECHRLRLFNVEATAKIKKLEDAGRHLHSLLRRMVQHNYREEFAQTNGHHSGDAFTNDGGFSAQEMRELSELFGIQTNNGEQKLQKQPSDTQKGDEQQPMKRRGRGTERKETQEQREDERNDAASRKSAIKRGDTGDGQPASAAQSELSLASRFHTQQHNQKTPTNASPGPLCRISRNGSCVAISALGSKLITIWSATTTADAGDDDGEARTPLSTIRLLAPLTSIAWIAASQDQNDAMTL
uniref:Uncharacterized protein n=1 Tax=Globisporangium ultimum (strain ATCC 200006 / CBS 805.95 / DAOM BR144) TaxID=431595 RepID=K3X0B4_GLOUD